MNELWKKLNHMVWKKREEGWGEGEGEGERDT
jgi:hypothetical protein